jgi:hypothetical protein
MHSVNKEGVQNRTRSAGDVMRDPPEAGRPDVAAIRSVKKETSPQVRARMSISGGVLNCAP